MSKLQLQTSVFLERRNFLMRLARDCREHRNYGLIGAHVTQARWYNHCLIRARKSGIAP